MSFINSENSLLLVWTGGPAGGDVVLVLLLVVEVVVATVPGLQTTPGVLLFEVVEVVEFWLLEELVLELLEVAGVTV